jgi:hypothetical protein
MVGKVESMFYRLGLTECQEADISESVRRSRDGVLELFDKYGTDFGKQIAAILEGLHRASTYRIDTAEESTQTSEVWV